MSTDGQAAAPAAPVIRAADGRESELIRTADQRRKWREAARGLTIERDAARAEAEKAKAAVEEAKAAAATLQAQLVEAKHRSVADRILEEEGIRDGAADAFYRLADLKFEGEPDPAACKTRILEAKGKLGYLFGDPRKPGPGNGQGGEQRAPGSDVVQVPKAKLSDPAFCFGPEWKAIRASGKYEIVD